MYKEKRTSSSEFVPIRGLSYHVRIWQGLRPDSAATASDGPTQARPAPPGLEPAAQNLPTQVWTGDRSEASGERRPARYSALHEVFLKSGGAKSVAANSLPPLVLVHGWMDVAASYQFMVDALTDAFAIGRSIIAPDWRGFGRTQGSADNYWFPDYLADLDFLLDHYAADQKIDLVGHSMGGNVAMVYAGVRPERIRRLVNLEGFGMAPTKPEQAPTRYAKWLDELKSLHKGELDLKPYDRLEGVAKRLMKTNPRLSDDKANWLASHWAAPNADGKWLILGEPGHKVISANIYRVEETLEIYKSITAPVLAVEASDDSLEKWNQGRYTLADYHERLKLVKDARVARLEDSGHMLHHDQPEALARLIEDFLN